MIIIGLSGDSYGTEDEFDIRKGEEQRRHLRNLKKRDHLCLSREILDVLIFTCS